MTPETSHITRLLKDPSLIGHYQNYQSTIKNGLTGPSLSLLWDRICAENANKKDRSSNPKSILETSTAQALEWVLRNPNNKEVSGSSLSLITNRIEKELSETSEEKPREREEMIRNWIERLLIQTSATAEPIFLSPNSRAGVEDPTSKCIRLIQELKDTPWIYSGEDKNPLYFPLQDTELNVLPKISLGLGPLEEEELGGGPEIGQVFLLSGITNVGKSHLTMFSLANLCLRKEPILIFSGEDGFDLTKKRILTVLLRCTEKHALTLNAKTRLERMRELYGNEEDPESLHHYIRRKFGLFCVPQGDLRISKISDGIKKFQDATQTNPSAFAVDYLQKCQPDKTNNRKARDEELEDFVNGLKDIANEQKNLAIIISQVGSASADGKQAFLSVKASAARSFAATWGADYILTLNRTIQETERLANAQCPEDRWPRVNIFLCKNKNGPIGTCYALGIPQKGMWKFFRTKGELDRYFKIQKESPDQPL